MNCLNCNKELIEAKRNTKRFCSDKCRVYYWRKLGVTKKDQDSVTNGQKEQASVTIKENKSLGVTKIMPERSEEYEERAIEE